MAKQICKITPIKKHKSSYDSMYKKAETAAKHGKYLQNQGSSMPDKVKLRPIPSNPKATYAAGI